MRIVTRRFPGSTMLYKPADFKGFSLSQRDFVVPRWYRNECIDSVVDPNRNQALPRFDRSRVGSKEHRLGGRGCYQHPVIVSGLIGSGRFDQDILRMAESGTSSHDVAWQLTDQLVSAAEQAFLPVWKSTRGNAGWSSFELDPLIEDESLGLSHAERVSRYVELGKKWSSGHHNRMIKVPATAAGIEALEPLAAAGVTLNVTLIFTIDQYRAARDSVWSGAKKRSSLDQFKSVYSIFVSVSTNTHNFACRISRSLLKGCWGL